MTHGPELEAAVIETYNALMYHRLGSLGAAKVEADGRVLTRVECAIRIGELREALSHLVTHCPHPERRPPYLQDPRFFILQTSN